MGKLQNIRNHVAYYPEIPLAFYLFALMLYGPVLEQYLYMTYSKEYGFNYLGNGTAAKGDCPSNLPENSTSRILQKKVQKSVAQFISRNSLFLNVPSTILCLISGPLSDQYGRKPIIYLGLIAALLNAITCSLISFNNWNVDFLNIGSFILGLGGYYLAPVAAVGAYICDLAEPRKRAMRIAVIELILFLCITLSTFTGGVFLQQFGFNASFIFMNVLLIVSILISFFVLKESLPLERRIKVPSYALVILTVYRTVFKSRPSKSQLMCFVAIVTTSLLNSPSSLMSTILLYLLNVPFCWNAEEIGFYRGTYFLLIGVGCVVGAKLLPKIMKVHFVLTVGLLSSAAFYVSTGFSHTKCRMYLSLIAGFFLLVNNAILKGQMSQWVTDKEQGCLFAFLSSSEGILVFLSTFMYQVVYQFLNERNKPGYTFFLAALLNVLPFIFIVIFWVLHRKKSNMARENSKNNSKEISSDKVEEVNDVHKPLLGH